MNDFKNKKNVLTISGIVLAVIVVAAILILVRPGGKNGSRQVGDSNKSLTMSDVPEGIKVPEMGEEVGKGVAAPEAVASASVNGNNKYRIFSIAADKNAFSPDTIIVNVGDVVHINFTAVDKTYDLTIPDYGMKQTVYKGETKVLEFQTVNAGKFMFYCDLCGGLNSEVKGYVIATK